MQGQFQIHSCLIHRSRDNDFAYKLIYGLTIPPLVHEGLSRCEYSVLHDPFIQAIIMHLDIKRPVSVDSNPCKIKQFLQNRLRSESCHIGLPVISVCLSYRSASGLVILR